MSRLKQRFYEQFLAQSEVKTAIHQRQNWGPRHARFCVLGWRRREERLAVESQEVVPVQARAADRWSMVETTMRTMPVVVAKPGRRKSIEPWMCPRLLQRSV